MLGFCEIYRIFELWNGHGFQDFQLKNHSALELRIFNELVSQCKYFFIAQTLMAHEIFR